MTPRSPSRIVAGHCDRYVVTPTSRKPRRPGAMVRPGRAGMSRTERFSHPSYHAQHTTGAPPSQAPVSTHWARGPGFSSRQTTPVLTVVAAALRAHSADQRAPEDIVTYVDRDLICVDCGVSFIHSAADQEYYAQKGFVSDPKRCTSCRASRRAAREGGGTDVRDIGGPRGYEGGDDASSREYFAVVCSSCGNQAQVPFRPRMDRPVYCSDCFRNIRPD